MQRPLNRFLLMLSAFLLFIFVNSAKAADDAGGSAYYDLGVFSLEEGDYQDAEANFLMALRYEPNNAVYRHYLGKTYVKTDHTREAEEAFLKAMALDPDLSEIAYDLAMLYFNKNNYEKAADLFEKVSREEPANVLAHYYAGLSLHRLKRYDEAAPYFLAAAGKSPNLKTNGFYYAGACYYNMDQIDPALEKFVYVRDNAESEVLKHNAEKYIEAAEKKRRLLKRYTLFAKAGFLTDSNVTLEPIDEDFPSDQQDNAWFGHFTGTYDFIRTKEMKIGAGYTHDQIHYNSLDQYNLIESTAKFYTVYDVNPVKLSFLFLPSHYWLDTEDYMERYQFRPEIFYAVNEKVFVKAAYAWHIVNHLQFEDKDGHFQEGLFHIGYKLPENYGILFGGIGMENYSAQQRDEDYDRYRAVAGASLFEATSGIFFTLIGEFSDKGYDNEDSFYGIERSDDKYFFSASLSRAIWYDWLSLCMEYEYTKNDSNIDVYSYKRTVGSMALTINY